MDVSLADLQAVADVARTVDSNPFRVAGRFLGLSGDETRTQIPGWGYLAAGVGVGFLLGLWASQADLLRERLPGR